jgi:hypothetical protein
MEERLARIEAALAKILNNDLPHIQARLATIDANSKWLTALGLAILAGVITLLIQV